MRICSGLTNYLYPDASDSAMTGTHRNLGCDRVRSLVSLQLDGELSRLEEHQLSRHLAVCAGCRAYARDLGGFSGLLRATPPAEVDFPIELPRRRWIGAGRLQAAAAVAGMSLLVAIFAFGTPSSSQSGGSLRPVRSSVRPAFLDSQTYEQRLLREARQTHVRRGGGRAIPV
jgi:anti-sigma factor RsiW